MPFDENAPYTFIFDPIDGTDSYSQGMPTWCVGVGILDGTRAPVGSIIYAPRFGRGCCELSVWTEPESGDVFLNGEKLTIAPEVLQSKDVPKQITTGSDILVQLDMNAIAAKIKASPTHFKCKAFGSSLIHIISTIVFRGIDACVDPLCYVWDIAAAHAAVKKCGLDYQYCTGEQFVYDDALLIGREKIRKPLVAGTKKGRDFLISQLNATV